jgi:hypothetical protein
MTSGSSASTLDAGQAGLVVVAVGHMGAKVEQSMRHAAKVQQKQLKADMAELERDAASIGDKVY